MSYLISVMSYNIHHARGTDWKLSLDRIAQIIKYSGAHIVALNEVDCHFAKRSDFENQIKQLADMTKMDYAFAPALSFKLKNNSIRRQYGNALLSSVPIEYTENYVFEDHRFWTEDRSFLHAKVRWQTKAIDVFITHLSLQRKVRDEQLQVLLQKINRCDGPVLLLGDLNLKPSSPQWRRLTEVLTDVWHTANKNLPNTKGYTFSSRWPRARIDYIFASHHFNVIEAKVDRYNRRASDHLPVVATVRV